MTTAAPAAVRNTGIQTGNGPVSEEGCVSPPASDTDWAAEEDAPAEDTDEVCAESAGSEPESLSAGREEADGLAVPAEEAAEAEEWLSPEFACPASAEPAEPADSEESGVSGSTGVSGSDGDSGVPSSTVTARSTDCSVICAAVLPNAAFTSFRESSPTRTDAAALFAESRRIVPSVALPSVKIGFVPEK